MISASDRPLYAAHDTEPPGPEADTEPPPSFGEIDLPSEMPGSDPVPSEEECPETPRNGRVMRW